MSRRILYCSRTRKINRRLSADDNLGGILFRPGYCIVFTACSLFTVDLYGIEVTRAWLLAAFLLSFILSVATPPVLGGTTVCFWHNRI